MKIDARTSGVRKVIPFLKSFAIFIAQRYFRSNADDVFAAENSFMYGTSPANQVNR